MKKKTMKLMDFQKVRDGKYLRSYELTYRNKAGKEKKYEIVSFRELTCPEDLGGEVNGVSIVATCGERLLLLHEFRMGVNRSIYNLCAGMIQPGESIEDCIARELYEETGLRIKTIRKILPPSFAAVAISDTTTCLALAELDETSLQELSDAHTSENELIAAGLYTREEVKKLLETEPFSSRAQLAAYFFAEQIRL